MSAILCSEKLDVTPSMANEDSGKSAHESETGFSKRKQGDTENSAQFFDPNPKARSCARIVRKRDSVKLDLLDKSKRLASVLHMQLFLSMPSWFEDFKSQATGFITLGSGTYGRVYQASMLLESRDLSIKQVSCAHYADECVSAEEAFKDKRGVLLDKLEATVACFITRRVLQYCPNFCAYYGYQWGKVSVLRAENRLAHTKNGKLLLFGELGTTTLESELVDMLEKNKTGAAFSVLIQCLVATATMSRYGLSHNDLLTKNILISPVHGSVEYRFPSDLSGTGRGQRVKLQTHGVLAQLCDFGLCSQKEWLETYDGEQALLDCDPRIDHWDLSSGSLSEYYYGHTEFKTYAMPPTGMKLASCEEEVSFYHPLRYKYLKDNERDAASLQSEFLYRLTEYGIQNRTSRALRRYCVDSLLELERRRPASSDEFMEYVARVVSEEFVSKYVEVKLVFSEESTVAPERCYKLPTKKTAEEPRKELRTQLGRQPLFDEMLSSDRLIH